MYFLFSSPSMKIQLMTLPEEAVLILPVGIPSLFMTFIYFVRNNTLVLAWCMLSFWYVFDKLS